MTTTQNDNKPATQYYVLVRYRRQVQCMGIVTDIESSFLPTSKAWFVSGPVVKRFVDGVLTDVARPKWLR